MQVPLPAAPSLAVRISSRADRRGWASILQSVSLGLLSCLFLFATPSLAQPINGTPAQPAQPRDNLLHCQSILDSVERLHCYEKAAADPTKDLAPATEAGWRLVRTPNPQGGPDAVSIMRTADFARSDSDFAGLMVRCARKNQEVLIVVIQPLPPGAQPRVDIGAAGNIMTYTATVLPPGLAVLLPGDAAVLIKQRWRQVPELSIAVVDGPAKLHGVVSMAGLQTAFQLLLANCLL